jgi:hypothetical protein
MFLKKEDLEYLLPNLPYNLKKPDIPIIPKPVTIENPSIVDDDPSKFIKKDNTTEINTETIKNKINLIGKQKRLPA